MEILRQKTLDEISAVSTCDCADCPYDQPCLCMGDYGC